MESFGIASVAGIGHLLFDGAHCENLPLNNKWIPSLAGLLGGILGLVGWRFMPDFPAGCAHGPWLWALSQGLRHWRSRGRGQLTRGKAMTVRAAAGSPK